MSAALNIDWSTVTQKWIACLDLLGFSDFVSRNPIVSVFAKYELCLEQFWHQQKRISKLEYVHFSDTFLIYAPDDTAASFAAIESASRWLFNDLLQREIPVRGALACGEFYADTARSIFLGKALVEAVELEKRYNWIGLVLSQSATERMTDVGLPAEERLNCVPWDVPTRTVLNWGTGSERAFAYLIGASSPVAGENIYLRQLQQMSDRVQGEEVKTKYENTIRFLKTFEESAK